MHPDAPPYRNKFVPIYHKLCVIFGQEISEGKFSHSACSVDHNSDCTNSMMGMSLLLALNKQVIADNFDQNSSYLHYEMEK